MANEQEVIILLGLPGSGKSTMATLMYPDHVRVNQDSLGSRNDCLNVMRMSLKEGKSVIVDRTNINKKQRKYFLDVANVLGIKNVTCLFLDVPADVCIERISRRTDHPNLTSATPNDKIIKVVSDFNNSLELPDESEGFTDINHIVYKLKPFTLPGETV